jgi:hypothetical protein
MLLATGKTRTWSRGCMIVAEEVEKFRDSRSVSVALGTSMLPGLPVLNGMIAAKIALPFEKLISKDIRRG